MLRLSVSKRSMEPKVLSLRDGNRGLAMATPKDFFFFFFSRLGLRDQPFSSFNFFFFSSASRNLLSESSCKMMDSFLGPPSILPNHHQQLLPFPFSSRSFTSKCFFLFFFFFIWMCCQPASHLSINNNNNSQQQKPKLRKRERRKKFQLKLVLSHHSHLKWKDYQVEH